ncbi:MAG: VanW family protein, partial [Planifilum fulgidum]
VGGKRADSGSGEGEAEGMRLERISHSRKDRLEEQNTPSVFDRTGQGLIRLIERIPLIKRLPLDRLNPRAVSVVTLALVIVLAGSLTAFAFMGEPETTAAVQPTPQETESSPEEPPEPAMLILQDGEKKWEMDLRSIGYDGEDIATVDREKLEKWLKEIKKEVDEPAKDARMERWGAPIQPSKEGKRMDLEEIEESWLPHLSDYINEPQEIPFIAEKPRVTEKDLRAVNQRRIGRYTTYFDASNVNRTTNIRLSAAAINNLVLNPGETFSFNQVVGQRTPERGYKPAAVIVRGEYSEGIGGGICQTSSTLYNSVDAAGLRVTVRYSHSKEVTYVPAGRDATVSWGGPDFRFMNSLDKPIMIKTYVGEGFITVSIYTTPDAKVVQRSVPPAPKMKAKQVEVDPDKPSNETPASGSGQGGDSGNSSGNGGDDSGNSGGSQGGDQPGNQDGGQGAGSESGTGSP